MPQTAQEREIRLALALLFLIHERARFARLLAASSYDRRHAARVYAVVLAATGARSAARILK